MKIKCPFIGSNMHSKNRCCPFCNNTHIKTKKKPFKNKKITYSSKNDLKLFFFYNYREPSLKKLDNEELPEQKVTDDPVYINFEVQYMHSHEGGYS